MNAPLQAVEPDRARFLGGSDAAAVLGVSPWKTPVELWMAKTGRKPRTESHADPATKRRHNRGHKLEPFIRDMVIDKLRDDGHEVELLACSQRYIDPEHAFLSCEIDFELMLDGEHINCDAKSVSGFARKKWGEVDTEDVPIEYAAQFMHGLMVTGRRRCLVAALRSFDDVDIFWTLRDDETIAAMRAKLVSFWLDHVLTDVPPDPLVFDDITALFPSDNGLAIEATEEIADKVARHAAVLRQIKLLAEEEEELKFAIGEYISPNARLTYSGRDLVTWKAHDDTRLDTKALRAQQPELFKRFSRTKAIRVLRHVSSKGN